MPARHHVRVGWACDNQCVFCGQDGAPQQALADPRVALAQGRAAGASEVNFVGGEPALEPKLGELIVHARTLGYLAIGLQSNGRALAEPGRVDALVDAGLTDLHLSIHGPRADVHDYHTGVEGSFEAGMRTLAAARRRGVTVVVTTVLGRSSMRTLAELAPLLAGHGVAAWQITWLRIAGRAADAFDRLVPRLALAVPFALHALDRAQRLGVAVALVGVPACLMGPVAVHLHDDRSGAFSDACAGCAARDVCVGLAPEYLARFGPEELHRRTDVPIASAMSPALARMFAGPGVLAERTVTLHPSAAAARLHLPQLGKSRPAVAEVTAVERKSDARGLFPQLDDES